MLKIVEDFLDFEYIVNKLNTYGKIDYLTSDHISIDFNNKNLYAFVIDSEIVAIASVIWDKEFEMFYVKRLKVFVEGKGYATRLLDAIAYKYPCHAITPFTSNTAMIRILNKLGYVHEYNFLEHYMFFTKNCKE